MWLIRMLEAQPVGDLLGRVLLLQPLRNLTSQPPVSDQPADPGPTGLLVGTTPRLTRPVAAAPTVAVDLPGDRRGRPAKLGRDVRETASCGHTEPDIFTLVDRQPRSWHLTHLRLGNDTLVVQRAVALQPLPERGGAIFRRWTSTPPRISERRSASRLEPREPQRLYPTRGLSWIPPSAIRWRLRHQKPNPLIWITLVHVSQTRYS